MGQAGHGCLPMKESPASLNPTVPPADGQRFTIASMSESGSASCVNGSIVRQRRLGIAVGVYGQGLKLSGVRFFAVCQMLMLPGLTRTVSKLCFPSSEMLSRLTI